MNKKGFTLVELLAVIVILTILSTIAVRGYMRITDRLPEKQLKEKIVTIEKAAMDYGQDKKSDIESTCTIDGVQYTCLSISVSTLIDDNRIDSEEIDSSGNPTLINNVTKKDMKNDKVFIYRKNNRVYATMDCAHFASNNNTCPE